MNDRNYIVPIVAAFAIGWLLRGPQESAPTIQPQAAAAPSPQLTLEPLKFDLPPEPPAIIEPQPAQPAPVAAPPAPLEPKQGMTSASCADGSCGVGSQSFRPFRRLFGR